MRTYKQAPFGGVVDFDTMVAISRGRVDRLRLVRAGNPGKGRKQQPLPFSVVVRMGYGKGTFYSVVESYARLGNAARKRRECLADQKLPAAWICLSPGYTLLPRREKGAR